MTTTILKDEPKSAKSSKSKSSKKSKSPAAKSGKQTPKGKVVTSGKSSKGSKKRDAKGNDKKTARGTIAEYKAKMNSAETKKQEPTERTQLTRKAKSSAPSAQQTPKKRQKI